jgi:hypothetical protein
VLAAAVAYGGFFSALHPGWPTAMNDDFAYLRSIVESIQHGRPWTDDFLEPWSLSLVGLSAAIFETTHRFTWATVGLQTVLASLSFWFIGRIALDRGSRVLTAIGFAAALLTFPTLLWKQIEFTAMILYLPCLFAAVWSAARERWAWFFVAWAIAVASRQSAAVWLVIPAVMGLESAMRTRSLAKLKPAAALAIGALGWFLLLAHAANPTHAQRFITDQIFQTFDPASYWANLRIGLWTLAVSMGVGALLFAGIRREWRPTAQDALMRGIGVALAIGLLASVRSVASGIPLSYEHPFFENLWAEAYLKGLVLLGALGWIVAPLRLNLALLGAALLAIGLASVRAELWDYYLIDGAVLAFFAVRPRPFSPTLEREGEDALSRWSPPVLTGCLLLTLVIFQIDGTAPLKRLIDNRAGACSVLEKAIRAHWMQPTELSDAPFGFVAWHLLPYYLQHEGKSSADLGGFGNYSPITPWTFASSP